MAVRADALADGVGDVDAIRRHQTGAGGRARPAFDDRLQMTLSQGQDHVGVANQLFGEGLSFVARKVEALLDKNVR